MAASIKSDPRYDYRVAEMTDEVVTLKFFERTNEGWQELGESRFTISDATKAGLTGKGTWKQYPRNMLFARAMSNGVRWYCPDAFGGNTVYTPEELDAPVDGEGDVITVSATPAQETAGDNGNGDKPHWIESDNVRRRFWAWANNDLGLTDDQVHAALGVEHVADYTGSMQDAKDKILEWIDDQANMAQAEIAAEEFEL